MQYILRTDKHSPCSQSKENESSLHDRLSAKQDAPADPKKVTTMNIPIFIQCAEQP